MSAQRVIQYHLALQYSQLALFICLIAYFISTPGAFPGRYTFPELRMLTEVLTPLLLLVLVTFLLMQLI